VSVKKCGSTCCGLRKHLSRRMGSERKSRRKAVENKSRKNAEPDSVDYLLNFKERKLEEKQFRKISMAPRRESMAPRRESMASGRESIASRRDIGRNSIVGIGKKKTINHETSSKKVNYDPPSQSRAKTRNFNDSLIEVKSDNHVHWEIGEWASTADETLNYANTMPVKGVDGVEELVEDVLSGVDEETASWSSSEDEETASWSSSEDEEMLQLEYSAR